MDSRKRIMRLSFKNREECATYVSALLTTSDQDAISQLTIVMKPDGSGAFSAIPVTTASLDILSRMTKRLPDAS
jgi:hypothetical protein